MLLYEGLDAADDFLKSFIANFALIYHVFIIVSVFMAVLGPFCSKFWSRKKDIIKEFQKSSHTGSKLQLIKYKLQLDIDNSYQKPSYHLDQRSSKHLSLILSCFIFSVFYPILLPFGLFYVICLYYAECYMIARVTFLRPKEDIFFNELIKPVFVVLNLGYLAKLLLSLCIYAHLTGTAYRRAQNAYSGAGNAVAAGLFEAPELALPFLL